MNKFLPVKIIKYNKHKHKKSYWITQGIIRSTKFRDKLYSKIKQTPIHAAEYVTLKTNLHTYNAILNRNVRLAKQMYYQTSFERNKYDIKKACCMIKQIILKIPKKEHFHDYFKIDGKIVTYKNTIANKFNSFFTNIRPTLACQITNTGDKSFKDYLKSRSLYTFEFKPLNENQIMNIIDNLHPKLWERWSINKSIKADKKN